MKLYLQFVLRYLYPKPTSNFSSNASILAIIGLSIGLFSLILTMSIIKGFESVLEQKLSSIDGLIRVQNIFGKPISEHQAIQIKLAEMATKLEASRLLTEQAAKAYDSGNRSDLQAGMAKLFATETALFNSTEAMRIHGGFGYSPEYNIERYYRDAPLLAIGEGTNELQKLIIAKQLVSED